MKRKAIPARTERAPRAFWFDPRFGIGVALVVASVLGVVWLVSSADRTVQVWAARAPLSPGETVERADLELRSVRLGESGGLYLAAGRLTDEGLVVTRAVAAGELVPASAVGSRAGIRYASVVVMVQGKLPQAIAEGSVVDVWSARQTENRVYGPPAVLVSSATVVRVWEADGLVVDGTSIGVEVLVPRTKVAVALEAIANRDAVSLVPVSLPAEN